MQHLEHLIEVSGNPATMETFDTKWTPVKRLHAMRDSMPDEAGTSVAWTGTLPMPSEPTHENEDAAM